MKKQLYIYIICFMSLFITIGYAMAEDVYMPRKINPKDAPKLDGILDEAIWSSAYDATGMTVIMPDTHKPASLSTHFKFLYDDKNLYIGAICEQPADTHVRRLSARDDTDVQRDQIRIMLDPSGEGNYGYLFDVGLGDSLIDGTIRPEKTMNYDWDGPWQAMTSADADHWYAELEIPWDIMQFPHQEGKRRIGVLLRRYVPSISEFWAKPHLPMISSVYLSAFAPMEVTGINPKGRITFYPYVAVGYNSVKEKTEENMGADIFWQPSAGLLASATINPDYGDVESDEVVVNLSAVETFYEEKRSFFVEGNDIFKTWSSDDNGLNLVHTRRIGGTPDSPDLNGGQLVSRPMRSDILAAMKATGQLSDLRYGFMTAFEDDSDVIIHDETKGTYEKTVNGRDFLAARMLYEYNNNKLGYLGTYTHHDAYDAWIHSIDGQWVSADQKWWLINQVAVSDVDGEEGFAWNGRLLYSEARKQEIEMQLDYIDDQFEINDFGYLERNDQFGFKVEYSKYDTPINRLKELRWFLFAEGKANEHLIEPEIGGRAMMNLRNNITMELEAEYIPEAWDDITANPFNHGDADDYQTSAGFNASAMMKTPPSYPIRLEMQTKAYTEDNGGITKRLKMEVEIDFMDEWQNDITFDYYKKNDWIVWRTDRLYGFDADELTVTINSGYQIARNQELRVGVQWIGVDAEGKTAYDIGADGDLIENSAIDTAAENFNRAKFVAQIRYKYEFAPLSDLYLVYNRGSNLNYIGDNYTDDFGDLLSDSIDQKDVDLVLMKIRYRF